MKIKVIHDNNKKMKQTYLQAMGIVSWVSRVSAQAYHILNSEQKIIGVLIAQAHSSGEQELLEAIRRALPLATQPGQRDTSVPCLVLGKNDSVINPLAELICTHSLADMLENAKLKAVVWQDIKNFMNLLSKSSY